MNSKKDFYFRHPLLLLSLVDKKYFKCFFQKNLLPKKGECLFCGKKFHNYYIHGYISGVAEKHNVSMGPRFCTCPYCHSKDKYRWLWYIINNYTDLLKSNGRLLHFAPETPIKSLLNSYFHGDYFGGDIEPDRADYVVDMTDICFEDKSFDFIIACNVLEHIYEEKKALEELKRVITPNGTIILSFPVAFDMEKTFEDRMIFSKEQRIEYYGQEDHVRLYGRDYIRRLEAQGFHVTAFLPKDVMPEQEIERFSEGFTDSVVT